MADYDTYARIEKLKFTVPVNSRRLRLRERFEIQNHKLVFIYCSSIHHDLMKTANQGHPCQTFALICTYLQCCRLNADTAMSITPFIGWDDGGFVDDEDDEQSTRPLLMTTSRQLT